MEIERLDRVIWRVGSRRVDTRIIGDVECLRQAIAKEGPQCQDFFGEITLQDPTIPTRS